MSDTRLTDALVDSHPGNLLQAVIDHARVLEQHCEAMATVLGTHIHLLGEMDSLDKYEQWKREQLRTAGK